MINSSTQDRIREFYLPNTEITGLPTNKNYSKQVSGGEILFAADNDHDNTYSPIQQSSTIMNMDTGTIYMYIIDTNPGAQTGQTGHWKEL